MPPIVCSESVNVVFQQHSKQMCVILACSSRPSDTEASGTQVSAETASSSSPSSAAAAVTPGSSSPPVASWQLELFGTWTSFSDTESAQIEKAYCDPNSDSFVVSLLQFYYHC